MTGEVEKTMLLLLKRNIWLNPDVKPLSIEEGRKLEQKIIDRIQHNVEKENDDDPIEIFFYDFSIDFGPPSALATVLNWMNQQPNVYVDNFWAINFSINGRSTETYWGTLVAGLQSLPGVGGTIGYRVFRAERVNEISKTPVIML